MQVATVPGTIVGFQERSLKFYTTLLTLSLEDSDPLLIKVGAIEKSLFDCSLHHKELSHTDPALAAMATHTDSNGVKLPKLDVPLFNGNLLSWTSFWEQFCISVHNRSTLSDAEKFVYLQQALKGGTAKSLIDDLSQSAENYNEAVECLKARYDRPRLIHKAHVRKILECAPLKEGSGKELRALHDTVQQHLRSLKSMGYEPSGPFITSALELKLDGTTMFKWQTHSQKSPGVPHYDELLSFIDLRAQATESQVLGTSKKQAALNSKKTSSFITSHAGGIDTRSLGRCPACDAEKHPMYCCPKFKLLTHEAKLSLLKANKLCTNCLGPGHFRNQCGSTHRCKMCQKPHHTLLHVDRSNTSISNATPGVSPNPGSSENVSQHGSTSNSPSHFAATSVGVRYNSLLMTCRVCVRPPNGSPMIARALLDSASSSSFISERLAQSLSLPRTRREVVISGVAGLTHQSQSHSFTTFGISPINLSTKVLTVTAAIAPRVTCELPPSPISLKPEWDHLTDLQLADPDFGRPGQIDLLLGVDIFVEVLLAGRRFGPPGTPTAFETHFGWVLAGSVVKDAIASHFVSYHVSLNSCEDILRRFWEIENAASSDTGLSPEERSVVHHFEVNHQRTSTGRFVVPLPRKPEVQSLGESRSQAVRRFLSLERTLHSRNEFGKFGDVINEYFDLGHAELVPPADLNAPTSQVFYLPMHAVHKQSSTTTKIRAVFDASMKSASGVSLNDTLMVGPTVHPQLVNVLLRFRMHRIALVADVSKMYRAIELPPADRDLHRFVWRNAPGDTLKDYRMTRVTFGVSSSSFAANMCVKQNAKDFALKYPIAAKIVDDSFYVDDCLAGADSVEQGIEVHGQLQGLFSEAEFLLRKWNSSSPSVLEAIPAELRDSQTCLTITEADDIYAKTLGVEWHSVTDHFRLDLSGHLSVEGLTKRVLVSDIAKIYDVLGWFAPMIIKAKILLQRLWESKVDWDEPVPELIEDVWARWRSELKSLSQVHIPRCYFPKNVQVVSLQLHGFSDASQDAYSGVVYLRMQDTDGDIHVSLVTSKTKVSPIKRLTIPRLELCGAQLLTKLLNHVRHTLNIPIEAVFAWTDSTIVLNWLDGSPRRFKTYVGNRVSFILSLIPSSHWRHVGGEQNPADCASRGLFPEELIEHNLWWHGPSWLKLDSSNWPGQAVVPPNNPSDEQVEICLHSQFDVKEPIISFDRFSSYSKLVRVTSWVMRFITNLKKSRTHCPTFKSHLTVQELAEAETYWLSVSQRQCFGCELKSLHSKDGLSSNSAILPLHPFVDSQGVLRVGGRKQESKLAYMTMHPVILSGKHPLTRLIIRAEHLRLLHSGPTLIMSSLQRRYHIIGGHKTVRSVTRACVTCLRRSQKPRPQMMGQLPMERVTPDIVFQHVGVDYAGPILVKYGHVRKPTLVKTYICVFVSLSVKAAHLELVSDLTTEAFISAFRRFMARRGKPSTIWSDHGSNFIGAQKEFKQLREFLEDSKTQNAISQFCTSQKITWKFIPECSPHFGGLWESCVKSMKYHLKRIVADVKLTFEEYTTVLTQVEACLNSRPLVALTCDDDGFDALTPGHFLIGRPLEALPDPSFSYRRVSLLRRWNLCQNLVRQFWQRWSTDYLSSLRKHAKWHKSSANLSVGDIVVLHEGGLIPTTWPLGRVVEVFPGKDGLVRVANVKTKCGIFKRAVHKLALLLPNEQ